MYFSTKNILKSNHNYSLIEKFKKKIEKRKEKKRKKGMHHHKNMRVSVLDPRSQRETNILEVVIINKNKIIKT
jgi:ATP-dependent protease HslVU (ClpYQ) peptidase subunit